MARVVMIVDSDTGELIDVAGNVREGGRYKKLAKRMLSPDGSGLDYGFAGGNTLTISKGGGRGSAINLLADTVNVPGELKVGGKTIAEIAAGGATTVLDDITGTEGQVDVSTTYVTDQSTGETRKVVVISLDALILAKLQMVEEALEDLSGFVSKSDIAAVVENLSVGDSDSPEVVRGTLRTLVERLHELAGDNQEPAGE